MSFVGSTVPTPVSPEEHWDYRRMCCSTESRGPGMEIPVHMASTLPVKTSLKMHSLSLFLIFSRSADDTVGQLLVSRVFVSVLTVVQVE